MRISAESPRNRAIAVRQPGFTLLEMVVVLVILGLATAIAAPAAMRGIETWQRRGEFDRLSDQIRALPARARAAGHDLVIDQESLVSEEAPLVVDAGWTLNTDEAWIVRYNGVCEGGTLSLGTAGRVTRIAVRAPFCEPEAMP